MDKYERNVLIDQLNRSFMVMPKWVQGTVKHALGAPHINPSTGAPFKSFREVIEVASDSTLETLKEDFEDNGELLPPIA